MRTKDARIDDAIVGATIELLDEIGYQGLTIGAVASRAGVHRPAVYRRWASKRHLVGDAVASQMGVAPTPDTGDVRADLVAGITTLVRSLSGTALGRVLPALVADLANDAELAAEIRDRVFDPPRDSTAIALRSAIARGDIRSDIDIDFVLDALAAPVYYRILFGHLPVSDRLAEQVVDTVLAAVGHAPAMATRSRVDNPTP
jgi:AcrR family transcriptional regulator